MNYATVREIDTANTIGCAVSLFVSGCRNHCEGCFNPETWNFGYGKKFTDTKLDELIELINRDYIDSFSMLGGDPFEPENIKEVLRVSKRIREEKPSLTMYIWSGYLFEDLMQDEVSKEVLSYYDYLIDGKFELNKKDLSLKLRGSSNQRIIDLKKGIEVNL